MAHYAVIDDFRTGMPQTVLSFRPRGIACHTTEGGEGEAGALGTIQFLIDAAARNASYHEIWMAKNGGFEARRIVRSDRASHSMNPAQPPWNPSTRVRRILGDKAFDPNAVSYAVSIAGTTRTTVPKLVQDPGFMEGAKRRMGELVISFPSLSADPLFNHGEGQADRSDWGPLMRPALEDADVPTPLRFRPVEWTTTDNAPFWTGGPGTGEQKAFVGKVAVDSIAESLDGVWRLVRVDTEYVWVKRANLIPTVAGGDPAYAAAVRKVIEEGPAALSGDPTCQPKLDAALQTIADLKDRITTAKLALG